MVDINQIKDDVLKFLIRVVPKILLALCILIVGIFLINALRRFIMARIEARNAKRQAKIQQDGHSEGTKNDLFLDPTLFHFLTSILGIFLKVLLLLTVLPMMSIDTTSFLAIASVLTLVVGMSMQILVANLVGGLMILIFHPCGQGDLVDIQGAFGRVEKVLMFNTIVRTLDNATVFIPNGKAVAGAITNFTVEQNLRLDVAVRISLDSGLVQSKEVLLAVTNEVPGVLPDPAPCVLVNKFDGLGIELFIRFWVHHEDLIPVPFAVREKAKRACHAAGIKLAQYHSSTTLEHWTALHSSTLHSTTDI